MSLLPSVAVICFAKRFSYFVLAVATCCCCLLSYAAGLVNSVSCRLALFINVSALVDATCNSCLPHPLPFLMPTPLSTPQRRQACHYHCLGFAFVAAIPLPWSAPQKVARMPVYSMSVHLSLPLPALWILV